MNDNAISLLRTLADLPVLWGVQYIPPDSPFGPSGYVVNINEKYFWAASLEDALSKALDWKEMQDALRQQ